MFDTVHIAARVVNPEKVVQRLEMRDAVSGVRNNQGAFGRINSMSWRQHGDLFVVRGSLMRLAGAIVSSPDVARDSIHCLESYFGESLIDAAVWRMDIFGDLTMSELPRHYCNLLLDCPRLQRVECTVGSIRFESKRRVLAFYDKTAERHQRGITHFPNNVFRYELRYKKQITAQIGRGVSLADLMDPAFRRWAAVKWLSEYEKVGKTRTVGPIESCLHSPSSFDRAIRLAGFNAVGETKALLALERSCQAGLMSRSAYYNRKRALKEALADAALTRTNEAVVELDKKVAMAADLMQAGVL